jgi:DNA-binding GntR family transcriptional regulator
MSDDAYPSPDLPLGKISKSLPEQLAERLLEEIVTGRIPHETRLKEEALAREHAVSRATVREALIALAKGGYVERIPRFGARVRNIDHDDIINLFEIRAALLGVAARRCSGNPDPAFRAALRDLVSQMERLAADATSDPQVFSERSIRAQALLMQASGNRRLADFYEQLSTLSTWQLIRGRATSFLRDERRRQSAGDWRQIEAAINNADGDAAEQAARRLLANSADGVRAELARVESSSPLPR